MLIIINKFNAKDFYSFDGKKFWKAIEEKDDMLRLKVYLVNAMRNDPTFDNNEINKIINILEDKVPEIFEPEIKLEYEERLSRDKWDKGYFVKLTYWFQENFAKSRIDYIKEVGRYVFSNRITGPKVIKLQDAIINRVKNELNIDISKKFVIVGYDVRNNDGKNEIKNTIMKEIKKIINGGNDNE